MVEKLSTIILSSDSESLDENNSSQPGKRIKRDEEKHQDPPPRKRKKKEPAPESSQSSESSDDEKHCVWRNTLQSLLGTGADVSDDILLTLIQDRKRNLRQVLSGPSPVEQPHRPTPPPVRPFYRLLHSVTCSNASNNWLNPMARVSEELPHVLNEGHLGSKNSIKNLELYFARNPGLSFVIFKYYRCCGRNDRSFDGENPRAQSESVYILSGDLCEALKQLATSRLERKCLYPEIAVQTHLKNAYIWMFREYEYLKNHSIVEDKGQEEHLNLFLSYFGLEKRVEFAELRRLLSKNMINRRYLEYLFVPGEVVINTSQDPAYQQASRIVQWPRITHAWSANFPNPDQKFVEHFKIEFNSLSWMYSSVFHTQQSQKTFRYTAESDEPFPISQLHLYPLKYADEKIKQLIEERGRKFWACRRQKYVAYSGWDFDHVESKTYARFMVDFEYYQQQHGLSNAQVDDELAAGAMDCDEPPGEDFIWLLPTFVHGYSLEDKKWMKLLVTNTSEIQWDDDSFKTLVMDEDLKEMIMALVTNTLEPERSTDFFRGKGNGLVLLFHGGPGTGKTLTAERYGMSALIGFYGDYSIDASVAEFARKPLYRVTCGDIGTQPDQVEMYLKSALNIGARWDCVVLMDEAEVFLQERTLNDLNRNALVAVFLRVLEFYSGILILTSNRVGMFDEGFKSRIQLAVHYDKLSQNTRKRVWENFINRLESFKDSQIDIIDMRLHLTDLSRYPLNGREIRNAITTARQLAMFRKTPVDFKCLRHCIGISGRFETYLKNLHEGLDGDELAREEGFRA